MCTAYSKFGVQLIRDTVFTELHLATPSSSVHEFSERHSSGMYSGRFGVAPKEHSRHDYQPRHHP